MLRVTAVIRWPTTRVARQSWLRVARFCSHTVQIERDKRNTRPKPLDDAKAMKTKPVLAEDTSPKGPVGKIRTKKKKPSKEAKSSKSRAKKAVDLPREELEGSIQVETRGSSKEKKRDKSKSKMDNKKPSSKGRKR
eukprot:1322601-Amorphochlora_amoeboformis.AAC.1